MRNFASSRNKITNWGNISQNCQLHQWAGKMGEREDCKLHSIQYLRNS